jgi:hypothetical protein
MSLVSAAEETAEGDEAPIGSDLTEGVAGEDRVVADVVDFVLARDGRVVRDPQDHVGGGADGRRRVRARGFEEAVRREAGGVAADDVRAKPNDLTCVVNAPRSGEVSRRIVDVRVQPAAIEKAVAASVGTVSTYDLAQIVDAICNCGARGGPRNVEGGVGAAAQQEAVMNVVLVREPPDDLAGVVHAGRLGDAVYRRGQRIVEGGEAAAATWVVEEAVDGADSVLIPPDDLARVVDRLWHGAPDAQGIVDGGINAAAQEEAVVAVAVSVSADDLAGVVDAESQGVVLGGQGIGKRGVSASAQEEAVTAHGGCLIITDDGTRGVDAVCKRAGKSGEGIVQGREGLDWHRAASSDRLACSG